MTSTVHARRVGPSVVLSIAVAVAVAVAGCGGGSGAEGDSNLPSAGGMGSSRSGVSGVGSNENGGAAGAATAGRGSSTSTGGTSSGTGGAAGASPDSGGASSSGSFDECDPPETGLENCSADNVDHDGTGFCTEFYSPGLAKAVCGELAASGPCPRGDNLWGICVATFSQYQYAAGDGATFYAASAGACEASDGTWCGPR